MEHIAVGGSGGRPFTRIDGLGLLPVLDGGDAMPGQKIAAPGQATIPASASACINLRLETLIRIPALVLWRHSAGPASRLA
jgi:hypothetical protein